MILVITVVFVFAYFYLGIRLIQPAGIARGWKIGLWIAMALWFVLIFAGRIFIRQTETPSDVLSWITYVSLGLLSSLFFLLVIRDIVLLVMWGVRKLGGVAAKNSPEPVDRNRRVHLLQLGNLGVLGLAAGITSYGIFEARRRPGIVNVTVPIGRLPGAFAGFRIVQITDIHAGLTVGREWIERIAAEVQALKPDLIALTGDMVDGSVKELRHAVEPLSALSAPHGKFFVTGNHEYYSGAEEWVAEVRRMGYDVLLNEHRLVERNGARLVIGGVTDFSAGGRMPSHRSDPAAAFNGAPSDTARIFLAHQPKTLLESDAVDFDLMLCGHTHGGQFFPWNLLTAIDQPYLSGLHRPNGKWIYVSKGTGYWGPPVRLGARSEITVITLTTENAT